MSVTIYPPRWSLQSFEADLAVREATSLSGAAAVWNGDTLRLEDQVDGDAVARLRDRMSFASAVVTDAELLVTTQAELERAAGGSSRKVTSHALHGLHPYKGKFYPQLARALVNMSALPAGGRVLDPFAGCGTTIIEAALGGFRGIGIDANPLACLVSNTKLRLLSHPVDELEQSIEGIDASRVRDHGPLPDEDYLRRWFPADNLAFLKRTLAVAAEINDPLAGDAIRVVLSSVMREASYQMPNQLRVYRRKDGDEPPAMEQLFIDAINGLMRDLRSFQSVSEELSARVAASQSAIVNGDSRRLAATLAELGETRADSVITSPPYANALPYIDTDRLSLRAFGLLGDGRQRTAEQRMIGNREITDRQLAATEVELAEELARDGWCPPQLRDVLTAAQAAAREKTAGFRKRRTPALLFSYFRDMRQVLTDIANVVEPGGPVAIVIGDNEVSGPCGETIAVPTADIFVALGTEVGLALELDLSKRLTSFGATTTVHQRNAMATERVLIFRAVG